MTDSAIRVIPRLEGRTRRFEAATEAGAGANSFPRRALDAGRQHVGASRLLAECMALAAVYFLAGKLGLQLGIIHPSASAVWAPTGIALAALLLLDSRVWPGVFAGAFLVNITTAGSIATSLGIATGNTLEALLGAALVNRFAHGRHAFEGPQDTFRFALAVGTLGSVASATLGVASLATFGYARWADYGRIWLTWWLGDTGGALVVTPTILLWASRPLPRWTKTQMAELAALFLALLVVGQGTFGSSFLGGSPGQPLRFLSMPLLAWAAFRFDQRIAAAAILEIAFVAVWGALVGAVPSDRRHLNESLLMLQVFLGVAAVTTLALAAVVSERRRIDAAVRATSDDLHEAMTELEAFSHSITHDLRSPVGAVMNYSTILVQDHGAQLDEEGRRLVRRIRASAEAAARLLDQLSQYTWVGREESESRTLDMTALAREVHAELVVGGEDVSDIEFEIQPLPPGRGTPELLRSVFRNLLSNSVKYTRGRTKRKIRVSGVPGPQENTYIVSDNGIGFDPALSEMLFEPFRRLPAAQGFEGSGLGLAIVSRIIRRQHGRVWAESDGRSGARFAFTLPIGTPSS